MGGLSVPSAKAPQAAGARGLAPNLAKRAGEKFKHKITAQFRGISPIWTLSLCARDVGGMWMSPTLLNYVVPIFQFIQTFFSSQVPLYLVKIVYNLFFYLRDKL